MEGKDMSKKVVIGLFFMLIMLTGSLTPFLSAGVSSPGQPYQVAVSREYLNYNVQELDRRVKQLEMELNRLKQTSTDLEKNFTDYKAKTDKELSELKKLLDDHLQKKDTGSALNTGRSSK
jgi:hypothetical protein